MADETIRTVLDFEVNSRDLNRAISLLAEFQDKGELSEKQAAQLEKVLSRLGVSFKELAQAVQTGDKAAAGNIRTILQQEKAYKSYAESIRVAAQAERDAKKPTARDQELAEFQRIIRERYAARDKEAKDTAAANKRIEAEAAAARQRELTALRGAIQQRANMERQANKVRAEDAANANRRILANERASRQAELTALRQSIQERNRIQQRSSQAQMEYARLAQQQGVGYGGRVTDNLITQRYALYDVAATWGMVSAATLGAATAALHVGINYEKSFAQVIRTSDVALDKQDELKAALIDLTTDIPTDFTDIAGIATLGGQLGIAAGGIEDFTRVTAMLTATTDLSSEAAGTALGRFNALFTDVTPRQFEALGSSILRVGVNSVATETQIVSVATQISSMGTFAGLTADQVIGLSGALASVGAQPELSRGTITRTFSQMSAAVSTGGDKLEEFARVSGVSAEQFRAAWGTEDFADVFQAFLRGLAAEGQGAVSVLNDLGISSVRDVPLLLRLAGAGDVVTKSFEDAAGGFEEASDLQDHFAITSETVAAKLTRLGNAIQGALATVNDATTLGPLGELLNIVLALADGFLAMTRNPIGRWLIGLVGAFGLLVGVVASYRAMQALTLASMYAMQTATQGLAAAGVRHGGVLRNIVTLLTQQGVGLQRTTAFQRAYNASLAEGSTRAAAFAAGLRAVAGAATTASTAGRAMSRSFIWLGAISAGIGLLTHFANEQEEARIRVDSLTDSLDRQTGAITELTSAQIAQQLQQDGIADKARKLGLDLNMVQRAAEGDTAAMQFLRDQLRLLEGEMHQMDVTEFSVMDPDEMDANVARFEELRAAIPQFIDVLDYLGGSSDEVRAAQEALAIQSELLGGELNAVGGSATDAAGDLQEMFNTLFGVTDATIGVQNALYALGGALQENGTSFDIYSVGGRANMEALSSAINAMVVAAAGDSEALAVMLAGLMQQLSAYGVNAVNELAFVEQYIAQLTGGKGVGGMRGLEQATLDAGHALRGGYADAAAKAAQKTSRAGRSARDAAKEIRTLSDYVKDLSGVFRDAFEFRFGLDRSIDGVAEAYQKLVDYSLNAAEAVRDAQQAIRDADAEIRGLQAARGTLEYQLRVAQEYGDTLRANEILAELAKNEEELRKKQRDRTKSQRELDKAQDASRKSLDGQTEGSREQREIVLDLLGAYQDQVSALANTGLSQDQLRRRTEQLRQQFIAQLRQLGYNEREVQRYAKSFDDLTYAINNVPRNITVDANTDPAIRALNEFLARANNSRATIKMDAAGGGTFRPSDIVVGNGGVTTPALNVSHTVTRDLHIRELLSTPRWQERYPHTPIPRAKGGPVPEYHATGGVHGLHPGKPMGTDTTPAWLTPGEYVHQKKAVQYYGLPFMNALNNMQIPRYLANGSGSAPRGGNTGIAVVELSATDRALLAAAGNVTLTVDGRVLARTVNKSNANNAARGGN